MLFFKMLLAIYCLKVVVCLVLLLFRKAKSTAFRTEKIPTTPSVDMILPMHNEEKVIVKTIKNILDINYPEFSLIVIDDGSTDHSYQIVNRDFGDHPRVRILQQQKAGKSSALNKAMNLSQSDIIICIDADTLFRPDIIDKLVPYFHDERVAAVSGYINVGNRINPLTDMQHIEYLTIQNYERIMFDHLNGILVVPGTLGAFRRSAVSAVGGYASGALAEDCDLTLRILCRKYIIKNAAEAMSFTEAPTTAKMFFKQRVRWTVGIVQGLIKHGKQLTTQPNKALTFLVIPYTWLYRVILPFFIPLADYFFIYYFFFLRDYQVVWYYGLCLLIETLSGLFILIQRGERINPLKLIVLQRFYRHMTCFTYISIFFRWLNGNLFDWGKIPRQGNVKLD
jgi:cellulose synthase/poly-beta-1,6-N-acetylglucosamine synthase-like glycosyltransferase